MTGPTSTPAIARSLRLIPVHAALARSLVWIPIFILFTRARFDLDGALLLASLYYLFVVVLEVPSGWMSDRLGRVLTLRLAASSWIAGHACFLLGGDQFWAIVLGQLFMAGGFASLSGTDVAFHYDTLEALGLEAGYTRRQARVSSIGFTATAVSAVTGGALGLIDLRWAFAASLLLAVCQLGVTTQLAEPPTTTHAEPLGRQLALCGSYLRHRLIGWIFFYGIILVTLEHVAFTLMQPWLTEVLGRSADDVGTTPLFSGIVFATVAFVGAGAARASAPLSERYGTVATLIGFGALSAAIVTGMALWVHAAVLVLVAFRSAQGAAAPVLISAAVAPLTEQRHRATLLSINSLAGRLGYGLILLVISADAGDDVQRVLAIFAIASWAMVVVLIASAWAVRRLTTASVT
jgi:MFS family permease